MMYQKIRQHPTTLAQYADRLVNEGVITREEFQHRVEGYRNDLDRGEAVAWDYVREPDTSLYVDWSPYLNQDWDAEGDTSYDLKAFQDLADRIHELPEGFVLQRQVKKIMEDRHKMARGAMPINWGFAEIMAYATLLEQGYRVRLTGQDVRRGTFAHRHAVLHDQKEGREHLPLKNLNEIGRAHV